MNIKTIMSFAILPTVIVGCQPTEMEYKAPVAKKNA